MLKIPLQCDEARPSCNRCAKLNRVCLGYKDDSGLLFRHYGETRNSTSDLPLAESSHREAHMLSLQTEASLLGLDDARIEQCALHTFFEDYLVEPANRSLSRGFFDGLKPLIEDAGQSSDIAQAAKIVALAGIGNKLARPGLTHKTKLLYGDLLHSFQTALLANAAESNMINLLMTAVLLGIYEIITDTEADNGQHVTHVRGVSAILASENSPFDLFAGTQLFQMGNPLLLKRPLKQPQTPGVLCAPVSNTSVQSLDAILIKFNPVFHQANLLLSDDTSSALADIRQLTQDASVLDEEFTRWSFSQTEEWKPRKIGTISEYRVRASKLSNCWPGDVDSYLDLYVAAVWNSYRKTHLMILDIIIRCTKRLERDSIHPREEKRAEGLIKCVVASIPYHLTADPQFYVQEIETGSKTMTPGRPVGGLLLLHPLYVAARLSIVSPELRAYMSGCLAWIGKNMGIGQATVLSKLPATPPFPDQYIAEGHIIIWAGMLIHPV